MLATLRCHNVFFGCVTISQSPTNVTPATLSPESPPRAVFLNQISLRGAWGVAPYFHLK